MDETGLQGHRVKKLREGLGWTQEYLGEKIGFDKKQVLRFEKPNNNCKAQVIVALATALNTTSDYLLGLTENDEPRWIFDELSAEERSLLIALRRRQPKQSVNAFAVLTEGWE